MQKNYSLLTERPGKALFVFALPMILGNLFQQFYNMTDSVIVGQFVGEEALAAVGASFAFTTVFIMIAIGGGIGPSVLTSQYLGAGKYQEMKTSASTSLLTFLAVSILLALFGFFMNPRILAALNTPENIFADAVLYLQIYFIGLPFTFMYNVLAANFNALGRSRIPLGLLIFSSLFNIVMDLVMVLVFRLGVAGVAIATVIAQGISAVISYTILRRVLRGFDTGDAKIPVFDPEMMVKGISIAIPSIVQQSIVSIGMLLMQSAVNAFGSSALAGYSAGAKVESLCVVPMINTGNAVSTFTAQNLGAKQFDRVRAGLNAAYVQDIIYAAVLAVFCWFMAEPVMNLFLPAGSSAISIDTGIRYIRFIGFFYVIIGFKASTDGVLRGSGDGKVYMAANLINLAIRVIVARLLSPVYGIDFIWYAIPVGWMTNLVISRLWFQTGHWRKSLVS